MNQYKLAVSIARKAHKGQTRKNTGEPYLTHPLAVAGSVAAVTEDDDTIVAAILHDVVEDSSYTLQDIEDMFGKRVARLVGEVTNVSKKSDGNRQVRKNIDKLHLAKASAEGKTIKLADLINNLKNIEALGKDFAKVYTKEKVEVLKVLAEGDAILYTIAEKIINKYHEKDLDYDFEYTHWCKFIG